MLLPRGNVFIEASRVLFTPISDHVCRRLKSYQIKIA